MYSDVVEFFVDSKVRHFFWLPFAIIRKLVFTVSEMIGDRSITFVEMWDLIFQPTQKSSAMRKLEIREPKSRFLCKNSTLFFNNFLSYLFCKLVQLFYLIFQKDFEAGPV